MTTRTSQAWRPWVMTQRFAGCASCDSRTPAAQTTWARYPVDRETSLSESGLSFIMMLNMSSGEGAVTLSFEGIHDS